MYFDEDRREVINVGMRNGDLVSYRVLNYEQVKAVQMVIDEYSRRCEKSKDDIHQGLWREDHKEDEEPRQDDATSKNKHEIVFVTSYTIHDGFGSMQEFDVFNNEEDAWNFVLDKRDNEGITDISVMPRLVDGQLKRKKCGDE